MANSGDLPDLSRLSIDRSASGGSGGSGGRGGWWMCLVLLVAFAGWEFWRGGWATALESRPTVSAGTVRRAGGVVQSEGTSANGYVVARRQAALSTDIQGRIVELRVEEGDRVEEGELVARLDTRELLAMRKQTLAEIERAEATLALASTEFSRHEKLLVTGDTSVSRRDSSLAARDEARASLDAYKASLEAIDVRIDKSSVYAPFSGIITAKDAELGEVVSAVGAIGPTARGAVATLVDFETLEVQVELSQSTLAVATEGAPVRIYLDAFPRDSYQGRVRQIWPQADRTKATVEVRVEFLERDARILPELGVRAVFLPPEKESSEEGDGGLYAPASAIVEGEGGPFVFLLQGEQLVRNPVTLIGEPVAGEVKVLSGLQGNERVVLNPSPELSDGMAVRLSSPSQ
ncbi:MAG: efflux RND transporter periplasmic adaptor subunit [Planctomycetota bacterium]|nr:efflux RND transporter periplasmic adaptor subunit [Planctomycetota bacterium]